MVVLYEDTPTRDRAMAVCDHLIQRFCAEIDFDIEWWRFEFLRERQIAQEAGRRAAEADLILFSVRSDGDIPGRIKLWNELWLDGRAARPGAFIGLFSPATTAAADTTAKNSYLQEIAQRAGMDYLSTLVLAEDGALPDSIDSFAERAKHVTSVLDQILQEGETLQRPFLPMQ